MNFKNRAVQPYGLFRLPYFSHIKNEKSEALCRAKQKVICSYISRYDGTWKEREEDGAEFFDDSFHQGRDLDISGKASLYKLICSAYTFKGKKKKHS